MDLIFTLDRTSRRSLQQQIRDQIAAAILEGRIAPNTPLPSSRRISGQLGVARNTVMLAYTTLQEDGFLEARDRSGYYVNPNVAEDRVRAEEYKLGRSDPETSTVRWDERFSIPPEGQRQISKPANWREYPYGFVYGQIDQTLFPVRNWRECWRDAAGIKEITDWSQDLIDRDDPLLLEQIRLRLLPRRGLWVDENQILVTVGAQNALYIALKLLLKQGRIFGIEDPGYPDARNIASVFTDNIKPLQIDDQGLIVDHTLDDCDVVFTTPSHQSPTTVTMSDARRQALLKRAEDKDFLIIEDDYEAETNFTQNPLPALMSYDDKGRVIYIGSLSKTLSPGLRIGYLVGPPKFIAAARTLRRLMMRHPATNNQRATAYFLARGHHEGLLRALIRANKKKREILIEGLGTYLPDWNIAPSLGGSSFWITGPKDLDTKSLAAKCAERGVLIEPGSIHYLSDTRSKNTFRMGYTSIPSENIIPGLEIIADILGRSNKW